MNKTTKFELETILSKAKSIVLDSTMYSNTEIEDIVKIAKDNDCALTLQNVNHYSKFQIEKILKINPDVTLQFTNLFNMVTVQNVTELSNNIQKLQKQLIALEKKSK